MNNDFISEITGLANIAKPTPEQTQALLEGWNVYFTKMNILPEKQFGEFCGIMKARVMSGCISLVAPDLE